MMDFKSTYNHHEITARVHTDGSVNYMTEAIVDTESAWGSPREFLTVAALTEALDKYDLMTRKNFINKTAYMIENWYRADEGAVNTVEVTSLTSDGEDAWIKTEKGERRKVRRATLYADRGLCEAYLAAIKEIVATYEASKRHAQTVLDLSQWKPEVKP